MKIAALLLAGSLSSFAAAVRPAVYVSNLTSVTYVTDVTNITDITNVFNVTNQSTVISNLVLTTVNQVTNVYTVTNPAPAVPGEIWIAPGPTNAGTGTFSGSGTRDNPYAGDFDLIWATYTAPNLTVRLLPGTFWSKGTTDPGAMFRAGERLLGSGADCSIIERDRSFAGSQMSLIGGYCDNAEVAGLTLDINATNTEQLKCNGVVLVGTNNWVHNVNVIHPTGNSTNGQECFGILLTISGLTGSSSASDNIDHCEVSSIVGDYVSAIVTCAGGTISFCKVVFPQMTNCFPPVYHGFGGSSLYFNECDGGSSGWYTDSFWSTNVTLAFNRFLNVYAGIDAEDSWSGIDGLTIAGNTIELNPYSTNAAFAGGIRLWGAAVMRNVAVSENLVRAQAGQIGLWLIDGTNNVNIKALNNTFSQGTHVHLTTSNLVYSGNTDNLGNPMPLQ